MEFSYLNYIIDNVKKGTTTWLHQKWHLAINKVPRQVGSVYIYYQDVQRRSELGIDIDRRGYLRLTIYHGFELATHK